MLELCATASGPHNGQVAGAGVDEAFAVEHERHARNEVGLADDELAALLDLDDCELGQLDPQEASDREPRTGRAEQQAGPDEDQRVEREPERVDVAPGIERPCVQE